MDKTFNDLMDIVNRTKKMDSSGKTSSRSSATTSIPRTAPRTRNAYEPIEDDVVESPKKKRATTSSLFGDGSAIGKALNSKTNKKPTTKKSTKAKSATTTKSTKKTTKTTAKNDKTKEAKSIANKLSAVAKKTQKTTTKKSATKAQTASQSFDASDPKNAELYSALKSALFDGGTDISEYMPEGEDRNEEAKTALADLQAKREAQKINKEISKEQQEYEQLFNGSFFMEDAAREAEENATDEKGKKAQQKDLSGLRSKLASLDKRNREENREDSDQTEISVGNAELDRKIAEYYKRKQEKINELIKQEAEEELEVKPEKVDEYSQRQSEYEDIFSGEMISRADILGDAPINNAEASVESEAPVETEDTEDSAEKMKDETTVEEVADAEESTETETEENDVAEEAETDTEQTTETEENEETQTAEEDVVEATEDEQEPSDTMEIESEEKVEDGEIDDYIVESVDNADSVPVEAEAPAETEDTEEVAEVAEAEEVADATEGEEVTDGSVFTETLSSQYEKEEQEREKIAQAEAEEKARQEEEERAAAQAKAEQDAEYFGDINIEPNTDGEVDDYIVSSSLPEEEYRPRYEETDNSIILDSNAVNPKIDIFGEEEKNAEEEKVEDTTPVEEEKEDTSDTISKEEFYNEMSRLQENLINELKGNKVEEKSVDLFAEPVAPQPEQTYTPNESGTGAPVENAGSDEEAGKLVENIISDIKSREQGEEQVAPKVEVAPLTPEEQERYDSIDLLGKDNALGEEDLQYIEQKKKEELEHEPEKDGYLYGSAEHKEKEEAFKDEYMSVYSDESAGATSTKEMGDINLNKDIANAISSSQILEELEKKPEPAKELSEDEEMEMIYTLFGTQRKKVSKMENDLKVLYVASECQPFIATGGLADVAGSLPKAMAKVGGVDVRVIIPMYGKIKEKYRDQFEYLGNFTVHLSWRQEYCGLFRYYKDGVTYYFVDNERYFKRDTAYGYYDDGERFAYFSKAVVECLPVIDFFPDIIHCNDWQTALVSTYIKTGNWSDYRYYQIKNVYTIHNVEYQGTYGMENLKDLFGIDYRFRNEMEYNGDINLTKAAVQFCDKLTTVSNSYCDNLKQPYCSRGLHHIIIRNEYKLCGIINGVDTDFYNPATDTAIYKNYTVDTMQDKVMNKKIWQDELGLPVDGDTPMLAIVSRLVSHKGLDLVSKMMEGILQQDVQLVVVGTGDQRFIDYFKYLEDKYPTKVRAMTDKYSNELARKAYAASDIFLMPSKIEPCGISQMISSLYGSVPIVREVGGLKDTITDFGCPGGGNGYTFTNYNPNDLAYQVNRAINDYHNKPEWEKKMRICMTQDFTWAKSAVKYIEMYKSLKNR